MGNPFQDQLLKAGLVTNKQVQKAQQDKRKNNKQQRSKKDAIVDEATIQRQQLAQKKAEHDRALNRKKEEQARQKSISIEINQLIEANCLPRDENCEIVYHFEHNKKVRRVYVNSEMKQQIIDGNTGIARIDGRYELVPKSIAEKIQKRNAKRIVLFEAQQLANEKDAYSEYQIPDDLIW